MISQLFTEVVLIGILTSGIRLATPYLFASIGEMFGQRSGVYNPVSYTHLDVYKRQMTAMAKPIRPPTTIAASRPSHRLPVVRVI